MEREAGPTVRGHKVSHRWEGPRGVGFGLFRCQAAGGSPGWRPRSRSARTRGRKAPNMLIMLADSHALLFRLPQQPPLPPSFSLQPEPGAQ